MRRKKTPHGGVFCIPGQDRGDSARITLVQQQELLWHQRVRRQLLELQVLRRLLELQVRHQLQELLELLLALQPQVLVQLRALQLLLFCHKRSKLLRRSGLPERGICSF
ncbi:hypothetical protein [Limnohabitans sp.]|uniref:hypothetical protein n=1 Tax=Limnohabitans sp. TaxID=1907725 RepID=UPI0037C0B064